MVLTNCLVNNHVLNIINNFVVHLPSIIFLVKYYKSHLSLLLQFNILNFDTYLNNKLYLLYITESVHEM